ncbi:hypothetical protein [Algoriphagus sp. A40]|uniref:hypothetical protein n=1 Tax=Algoriphagus sp. A40 TaxID=1945863 RepID=UPI000984A642|nr:hypothetical protein [Algoriphagus sp. A40]OOG77495.1 hypothetical protein B0E43_05185 [Algoriphagus sp. A40]
MPKTTSIPLRFQLICLILGQLCFALSTFFWIDAGTYSVNSATWMFFSMVFWALGWMGLFGMLAEQMPIYSKLGLLYALYGTFGGAAFAMEGLFIETFDLSEKAGVEASEIFPLQFNLVLYQSGPAFPLSLLILGIVLAYRKKVTWPAGILLSFSGISFPVGRILRKVEIAHATDFLLLAAVIWISFQLLGKER